jgi:hypothetical protein
VICSLGEGDVEVERYVVLECPFYDDLRRDKKWSCH